MLPQNSFVGGAEHPIGKRRRKKTAGDIFAGFFHIARRKAGFLRHFLNNLRIIARNAQLFRDLFADGASAAAEFAADGDDSVFHTRFTPSVFNSL